MRCSLVPCLLLAALLACCSAFGSASDALRAAQEFASGRGGRSADEVIAGLRDAGLNDPVLEHDLRAGGKSLHEARARLRETQALAGVGAAQNDVNGKLRQILADPAFHRTAVKEEETLGYRIGQWITERMEAFGRWLRGLLGNTGGSLAGVGNVLYWGAIAILAALLVFVAFLIATRVHFRRKAAEGGAVRSSEEEYVSATAAEWLRRAEQCAARRDWRMAVRCLYMATLVRLDEAGLIRYGAGVTNWEYVRRVRLNGGQRLMPALEPMTFGFDRVWYGDFPPSEADMGRAKAGFGEISAMCGSRSEA